MGLLSRLFQQKLVNEAWVFVAPLVLGDDRARSALSGMTANQVTDGVAMRMVNVRRRGGDVIATYRIGL